jgi:hypothetical protein
MNLLTFKYVRVVLYNVHSRIHGYTIIRLILQVRFYKNSETDQKY